MTGHKNHVEISTKLDIPQFKEYAMSQIYCGYNSTHIVIGGATEGLDSFVYELGQEVIIMSNLFHYKRIMSSSIFLLLQFCS